LIECKLRTLIAVFGGVAGASLEEIIIGFGIRGKVNDFACDKLSGGLKDNSFALMVGAFKVAGESNLADILAAFGSVCGRDFIFGIYSGKRAFWHTRATINASVGVDIHPGPFGYRLAGDNALNRAHFNATAITNA
jgi:hypothetical protein